MGGAKPKELKSSLNFQVSIRLSFAISITHFNIRLKSGEIYPIIQSQYFLTSLSSAQYDHFFSQHKLPIFRVSRSRPHQHPEFRLVFFIYSERTLGISIQHNFLFFGLGFD